VLLLFSIFCLLKSFWLSKHPLTRNIITIATSREDYKYEGDLHLKLAKKSDLTLAPFVNRHNAILKIAHTNAELILAFRRAVNIQNYRSYSFCFAAQMYGAGKTRLGREMQNVLKNINVDEGIQRLTKSPGNVPLLKQIISEFSKGSIKYFDLGRRSSFSMVARFVCGKYDTGVEIDELMLGGELLKICREAGQPILFHFDECGMLPVDDLRRLRDACLTSLEIMSKEELRSCFPFFYFSGRGTAYNELVLLLHKFCYFTLAYSRAPVSRTCRSHFIEFYHE